MKGAEWLDLGRSTIHREQTDSISKIISTTAVGPISFWLNGLCCHLKAVTRKTGDDRKACVGDVILERLKMDKGARQRRRLAPDLFLHSVDEIIKQIIDQRHTQIHALGRSGSLIWIMLIVWLFCILHFGIDIYRVKTNFWVRWSRAQF